MDQIIPDVRPDDDVCTRLADASAELERRAALLREDAAALRRETEAAQ